MSAILTDKETRCIIPEIRIPTDRATAMRLPVTKDSMQILMPIIALRTAQALRDLAPKIPIHKAVIKTVQALALPMPTLRRPGTKTVTLPQGRERHLKDEDIRISEQALQTEGEFAAVPE